MTVTISGTSGIVNDATDLSYTGTLTGGTGVVNLGSGQVYKDASGNVGIGTSSPAYKLHIVNTSGSTQVRASSDTDVSFLATASGADSTAFVAVSNDARQWTLRVNGAESDQFQIRDSTAGATRVAIDSSGNLLVGTTSGDADVFIQAVSTASKSALGSRAGVTTLAYAGIFRNPNGTVGAITTNGSATTYATSSDYRLKDTIAPMTGALAKVALLKPCTYKWKVDGSDGQGFIAHELDEVVPGCVTGEKDAVDAEGNPQYQGIDTSFLVATLTAAIQEQQTLIMSLQDTLTALTARITALEAPIV